MTTKKMAIIATKGTLDMAYPPFILASTAAALGYDVQIFFTFYGLQLLRKDLSDVMIRPLATAAMPMPVPMTASSVPISAVPQACLVPPTASAATMARQATVPTSAKWMKPV